jgi:hypothetical protein
MLPVNLEEETAKLKEEIEGYRLHFVKEIAEKNESRMDLFGGLINSTEVT